MDLRGESRQKAAEVVGIAYRILEQTPEVIVRHRLLRDVLQAPAGDSELERARQELGTNCWIRELADEQRNDGGWGAFHSRSTRLEQKIVSTEAGVERALALGLDISHPVLQKAAQYIINIMEKRIAFPDYHEKNDRWPTGMRMFLASTLSLIQPEHRLLDDNRALWLEIAKRTFRSGKYSEEDEIWAHAELTGATVKGSYLVLSGRYQLNILGSIRGTLPRALEAALLKWLWERPEGIGYLNIPLYGQPPADKSGPFDRWLTSFEMLVRLFPMRSMRPAREAINWLWHQKSKEGYWDFGPRPAMLSFMPLSSNWKSKRNRVLDWTTRVLILLRKYYS